MALLIPALFKKRVFILVIASRFTHHERRDTTSSTHLLAAQALAQRAHLILSIPLIYGLSTSGTITVPSSC